MLANVERQRRIRASADSRNNMSRLEGKVAVISGGTNGIGLAIAGRFVQGGAHLFTLRWRRDALKEVSTS
jgi:NADP-dependent 3-hydroxy acid dehydrogenase YdfG